MNIEQLAQESGLLRYLTPPGTDEWHGRTADIARLIRNVTNVERAACAALAEDTAAGRDAEAIAEAIRMRHNVEFSGGAPLHGAASAGTQGYASGGGKDEA